MITHPRLKIFATVGADKFLRIYTYDRQSIPLQDKRRGTLINTIELSNVSRSCDFSPDGRYFVVGYDKGVFEVFQNYDNEGAFFQLECVKLFDLNREFPVQCIRFTPDGRFLVITCNKDIVVFNC
jgi:WD40 repeat protein